MTLRRPVAALPAALLAALVTMTACSSGGAADTTSPATAPSSTPGAPAPSTTVTASARPTPSARTPTPAAPSPVAEPTTTNTLPPPPRPSRPAPSTAGPLTAASLPVPAGWRTIARKGGAEEGYEGNGTWVHARDPRYAAHDVITLGCAPVTRDDYPDPTSALEGSYAKGKHGAGIGLVLEFGSVAHAKAFYGRYLQQVRSCRTPDGPLLTRVIPSPLGLIDQRSYPDGDWTEVGARHGSRLTLVILTDRGHRRSTRSSEDVLRQIAG